MRPGLLRADEDRVTVVLGTVLQTMGLLLRVGSDSVLIRVEVEFVLLMFNLEVVHLNVAGGKGSRLVVAAVGARGIVTLAAVALGGLLLLRG